jgi:hypothetical protein
MRAKNRASDSKVTRREALRRVAGTAAAGLALAALPSVARQAEAAGLSTSSGVSAGAASVVANQGKVVNIALSAEPNTFDPHLTVGRNTQIFIATCSTD